MFYINTYAIILDAHDFANIPSWEIRFFIISVQDKSGSLLE